MSWEFNTTMFAWVSWDGFIFIECETVFTPMKDDEGIRFLPHEAAYIGLRSARKISLHMQYLDPMGAAGTLRSRYEQVSYLILMNHS